MELVKFSQSSKILKYVLIIILGFILMKPVAYDGVRQYLFLLPFFAIFLVESVSLYTVNDFQKLVLFTAVLFYLIFTQSGLGEYKYIYLNELTNEKEISIDEQYLQSLYFVILNTSEMSSGLA